MVLVTTSLQSIQCLQKNFRQCREGDATTAALPGPVTAVSGWLVGWYVQIIKGYDSAASFGGGCGALLSLRSSPPFFTRLSPSGVQDGPTDG